MSVCERVSATIQREVTRARRELVRFVTTDSGDRNAELVLSVPVRSLSDSGWIRIKQGKAVCKVPKENRFREVVEGQYESVSARFEVLEDHRGAHGVLSPRG